MDYQKLAGRLLECGDRHSAPYWEGLIAMLRRRIGRAERVAWMSVPYGEGTVEFDAFLAGCDRGTSEWNEVFFDAEQDRQKTLEHFENLVKETA